MSKGKRYTQEFKIEAVKQITERDYSVAIRINRRANRGVAALEHQKRLNHHHYSLMTCCVLSGYVMFEFLVS